MGRGPEALKPETRIAVPRPLERLIPVFRRRPERKYLNRGATVSYLNPVQETLKPMQPEFDPTKPESQSDKLIRWTTNGRYRDIEKAALDGSFDEIPLVEVADSLLEAAHNYADRLNNAQQNFPQETQSFATQRQADIKKGAGELYVKILKTEGVKPVKQKPKAKKIGFRYPGDRSGDVIRP